MDTLNTEEMRQRFQKRADAVKQRTMPPVAGAERVAFIKQAEVDYLDYALIADAAISLDGGVLTIDLRPEICDATIRKSPTGIIDKTAEHETQVAMDNIAGALPTDGNKITPKMLDSKSDLQDLIDGSEMFRVVETIEPIDVNECPGLTLGDPAQPSTGPAGFSLTHGYLV
ncbi:MAG: hypothetical protein VX760_06870 [Actinomycetota bacterium]|nr:hypothetical protein [Actinomycetota bacterium]